MILIKVAVVVISIEVEFFGDINQSGSGDLNDIKA